MTTVLLETTSPFGLMNQTDIVYQVKAHGARPLVDEQAVFQKQCHLELDTGSRLDNVTIESQVHTMSSLMRLCWAQDPNDRPTFEDVMETFAKL